MILETDIDTVLTINNQIPEFVQQRTREELRSRAKDNYLALVYQQDSVTAGFKFGYALDSKTFYSWLGGVFPQFRGNGVAQQLLTYQEVWCKRQGYERIKVKSTNLFKPMLFMLIKNDYDIIATQYSDRLDTTKIVFSKDL